MKVHTAQRIIGGSNYYFADKLAEIRELQSAGHDVINLGVGNPDLPPMDAIVDAIAKDLSSSGAFGYQPYRGTEGLVDRISSHLSDCFGVKMDTAGILPLLGSKEGCGFLSLAHIDPGDAALIPDPGYPTYAAATKLAGGSPLSYPLRSDHAYHPRIAELEALWARSCAEGQEVRILWLNYPHMPSGTSPDTGRLQEVVDWAADRGLLVAHDNPYARILHEGQPFSIFSLEGRLDHVLELHSLSKSHRLAGARIGFAVGAPETVAPLFKVATQFSSGSWRPLQKAAMAALRSDKADIAQHNALLRERKGKALHLLEALNCTVSQDQIGLFVWARTPDGWDGDRMSDVLLDRHRIFLTPGSVFGAEGIPYVRLSLSLPSERIEKALERVQSNPIFEPC